MNTLSAEEYAKLFMVACEITHRPEPTNPANKDTCQLCVIKEKLRKLAGEALPVELRAK